jgi:hypothetical protein
MECLCQLLLTLRVRWKLISSLGSPHLLQSIKPVELKTSRGTATLSETAEVSPSDDTKLSAKPKLLL